MIILLVLILYHPQFLKVVITGLINNCMLDNYLILNVFLIITKVGKGAIIMY